MTTHAYSDVMQESPVHQRSLERRALLRACDMLRAGEAAGAASAEAQSALEFTRRLWTILAHDLAAPGNELPVELRARLVSIAIWVVGEIDAMNGRQVADYAGLISVCEEIAEGLH